MEDKTQIKCFVRTKENKRFTLLQSTYFCINLFIKASTESDWSSNASQSISFFVSSQRVRTTQQTFLTGNTSHHRPAYICTRVFCLLHTSKKLCTTSAASVVKQFSTMYTTKNIQIALKQWGLPGNERVQTHTSETCL